MGSAVILIVLAAAVVLALRSIVRDKRNGKSIQCGGDCSHCAGGCGKSTW